MTLRDRLFAYVEQELLEGAVGSVGIEDSLISRGLLDSMAVLGLMACIEEETGLRVPEAEVQLDHFESIAAMEALVERLRERNRG
jgi:acyl carrier protein